MTSGLAISPKMKARILAVAHKAICDVISLYLLISFRFSHDNLLPPSIAHTVVCIFSGISSCYCYACCLASDLLIASSTSVRASPTALFKASSLYGTNFTAPSPVWPFLLPSGITH